jgi:hypothetical protein
MVSNPYFHLPRSSSSGCFSTSVFSDAGDGAGGGVGFGLKKI